MQMSTESRIFFRLVELFSEHKAYDYNLSSYWNDDRKLVIFIPGRTGEAVIDFECSTNFDIDLRATEDSVNYDTIAVPDKASDDELKETVESVVAFLLNPTEPK